MKTICIIGASGFIGSYLFNFLDIQLKENFTIKGTFFSHKKNPHYEFLDITNESCIEHYLLINLPSFIILLAGTKDVKRCEEDFNYANALNTKPVENIIKIVTVNKLNTKVIFFSSDYVFDGERGYYKDIDNPKPNTNYGETKVLAEQLLMQSNIDFKIVRPSAVMGRGGIFFDWFLESIKNQKEVKLFNNTFFTPTPIRFLNEMILRLVWDYDKIHNKVIHIVGEKRLSRYDLALLLSSFIPERRAKLIPGIVDFKSSLLKKDLSLVQSAFTKSHQKKNFYEYMKQEVSDDKAN
ncbi:MAG: dTDP-4-dehydrorhamnose reductase [Candidatus Jettenia ecosi]|uniref:dTDP-4-dehydrorhamnose reductase n=1 Tax=Candidatus Jettenia ecosi TaxID=2494326 RepID=A0A533QNV7_9BACT|nr:MAG: dTDP-4-dehydrorhamnose reductase [Candidatus Jettenia ecosi]